MPERKIKVKSGRYETWMEVSEEIVEQQNLLKVLREALDRLMPEEKELAVKVIGDQVPVSDFAKDHKQKRTTVSSRKSRWKACREFR